MKTKKYFGKFYLDLEKDIAVDLYKKGDDLFYCLHTPNHHTGNLISNLAKLCCLELSQDEKGLKVIEGQIPAYIDQNNRRIYIFRLGNTKVTNIFDDGSIEMKAYIPAISKTLMSQTKDYQLDIAKTIIKSYILEGYKFRSDLHTHMNGILSADILIALGIAHQIRYPYYYIKKLGLKITASQRSMLESQQKQVARRFADSPLQGKYLQRRIDDNTFINFADLILGNPKSMEYNIAKIRTSLAILKDGQAVFTNLEKVYLYRYVFTKGKSYDNKIEDIDHLKIEDIDPLKIEDIDIQRYLKQIMADRKDPRYQENTLFQDKLLWIARTYRALGIDYVEISDTSLTKPAEAVGHLKQIHEVMGSIHEDTGVTIRFLAAIRRIPLDIIRDNSTDEDYLTKNLQTISDIALDPYVAGVDIVGEEINDIRELEPAIRQIVRIALKHDLTIRIHAGENDSLTDNIYNSIVLVKEALPEGKKMPRMRIGHGLYSADLKSAKGKKLLKLIKDSGVTLEFQISSNVRLNNLSSMDSHPLKRYLDMDIDCVVGTDGMALYGTNCIDEQLSLEKLLELGTEDMMKIKHTEERLIKEYLKVFRKKKERYEKAAAGKRFEDIYPRTKDIGRISIYDESAKNYDPYAVFRDKIEELPWDLFPIIIAGGSFNSQGRRSTVSENCQRSLEELLNALSPQEVFFVTGNTMSGYEKLLIHSDRKGFRKFCIVPGAVDEKTMRRLQKEDVSIRVSPERQNGLYKSFNYEIFERRPSILIVFDGNAAAANLIQEARNGKGKSHIFVSSASPLKDKAKALSGYVELFDESLPIGRIRDLIKKYRQS